MISSVLVIKIIKSIVNLIINSMKWMQRN